MNSPYFRSPHLSSLSPLIHLSLRALGDRITQNTMHPKYPYTTGQGDVESKSESKRIYNCTPVFLRV